MTVAIAPGLVILLRTIKQHYRNIDRQVGQTIELQVSKPRAPAVIVAINGWNRVVERAGRVGLM